MLGDLRRGRIGCCPAGLGRCHRLRRLFFQGGHQDGGFRRHDHRRLGFRGRYLFTRQRDAQGLAGVNGGPGVQVVGQDKVGKAHAVTTGDLAGRVALLDRVEPAGPLGGLHQGGWYGGQGRSAGGNLVGQPQLVALGHILLVVEHGRPQGRIHFPEHIRHHTVMGAEILEAHVALQGNTVGRLGGLQRQGAEIGRVVGGHLAGGQKFGIKVARGELERAAAVGLEDGRVVAVLLPGARHTGGAMVVGRDGQGPAAELLVIFLEQLGGGMGSADGVPAFVQDVVHGHEAPAGGTGELPDPRRAEFAVGGRVEGRFHMGQIGQVFGHPVGFQNGADFVQIGPGADDPGLETVLLADLAAHLMAGPPKGARIGLRPEKAGHPPAVFILAAGIGRQAPQDGLVFGLGTLHAVAIGLEGPGGIVGLDGNHLVDHPQIVAVMDDGLAGGVLAIDVDPEGHIGLDNRIAGKKLGACMQHADDGEKDHDDECGNQAAAQPVHG